LQYLLCPLSGAQGAHVEGGRPQNAREHSLVAFIIVIHNHKRGELIDVPFRRAVAVERDEFHSAKSLFCKEGRPMIADIHLPPKSKGGFSEWKGVGSTPEDKELNWWVDPLKSEFDR